MIAFDATKHRDKPNGVVPGMVPVTLLENAHVVGSGGPEPDWPRVVERVMGSGQTMLVNVESAGWETDIRRLEAQDKLRANLIRWSRLLQVVRLLRPDVTVGVYGNAAYGWPIRDYWTPVRDAEDEDGRPERMQEWHGANRLIRDMDLGEHPNPTRLVHYIAPSVYELYEDRPERWLIYAKANIEQARVYGKNVRPVMWMRRHGDRELLPESHWRRIIELFRAEGVDPMIWGSTSDEPREWPDGPPMWHRVLFERAQWVGVGNIEGANEGPTG